MRCESRPGFMPPIRVTSEVNEVCLDMQEVLSVRLGMVEVCWSHNASLWCVHAIPEAWDV